MKVVAVLLGPAGVGLIGILQSTMATVSTVGALGIGNSGTRQVAEANGDNDKAKIDEVRRALFWGTTFLAVLTGGLCWALSEFIAVSVLGDAGLEFQVQCLGIGVAFTVATGSQRALLNGMRKIRELAYITIGSAVASTFFGVILVYWLEADGIIWFILVAPITTFVLSHWFTSRLPRLKTKCTSIKVVQGHWGVIVKLGGAFMLGGAAVTLAQLYVRSLIQKQLGAVELGYFQAAWSISMSYIGFVLAALGTDYYPRLTAVIKDKPTVNKLVNEQAHVTLLLAAPILLAMLALAPWVIELLFSSEFYPAVEILRWQILGDVLKVLSWPVGFVILASGNGLVFACKEAAVMLVFVSLVTLLLPVFGVEAAGMAYLGIYLVNLPIVLIYARIGTGFTWTRPVQLYMVSLVLVALIIVYIADKSATAGALVGLMAVLLFGVSSLLQLATLSGLDGRAGQLATKLVKILEKLKLLYRCKDE